jgi:Gpi18-like mannosyltransferase
MKSIRTFNYSEITFTALGVLLAIALRYSLLDFKSVDFFAYTKIWYNTLKDSGFSAFSQNFSNYNLPYLYLLYLIARFFPDVSGLVATKLPSLIADFFCAWLMFRIVRLKYPDSPIPLLAALAVLYAPTVVLNSAFWGQADALYTAALLACLYFLLIKKQVLALLMFGLSISFKAQGVFLLPLLLALLLRQEISWRHFLLVPLVMLLALVPAWLAGRSLLDLVLIYPSQAGQYEQLSMHAPSAYVWIPDSGRWFSYFYTSGLVLAATVVFIYCIAIYRSQVEISNALLILLAFISVVMMPFFLPKMHERYFYAADIFSIAFAFYFPSYSIIAVAMCVISFFSYQPTLFSVEPVPISLLAFGILVLLVVLTRAAIIRLFHEEITAPNTEKQ